jgi:hypothetical protein
MSSHVGLASCRGKRREGEVGGLPPRLPEALTTLGLGATTLCACARCEAPGCTARKVLGLEGLSLLRFPLPTEKANPAHG